MPRSDVGGSHRRYRRQRPQVPETPTASAGGIPEEQNVPSQNFVSEEDPPEVTQTFVWGTNINVRDATNRFRRFVRNFTEAGGTGEAKYIRILEEVLEAESRHFNLDCVDLFAFDPELYHMMVEHPREIVPIFDIVVNSMAEDRVLQPLERHIQVRTFNLKATVHMRELNPNDIDQLVQIRGMIIRCSQIIPDIKEAFFKCLVCGHSPDPVFIDRGRIQEPTACARPECATKNSMTLVVGVFRATPVKVAPRQRTLKSLYKTYVDAIHIKKTDKRRLQAEDPLDMNKNSDTFASFPEGNTLKEDQEAMIGRLEELSRRPDIYEVLTRSIAPSIWELDDIKKGILCQLFGGVGQRAETGSGSFRGDINILLVGDPGTSKSQMLQFVHKIAPRGIYTSGRGSSAVGLTAYVTRDPETREMVLESGALVLSDKGICCIDEFDKMSDNARSMLHEVMEQQTVSVAKAGIIATLNARTSVLASANPSGSRYNPRLSVIDNIQLPPTLLSRFDLIYLVLDKADEQTDRRLARHLVALHYENPEVREVDTLDLQTLTRYISHARQHIHPEIGDDAAEDLINAYVEMRRMGGNRKIITATPRQLESLVRVSEALARMRFSLQVERCDVAEAVRLLRVAMQQSATDPRTASGRAEEAEHNGCFRERGARCFRNFAGRGHDQNYGGLDTEDIDRRYEIQ
ncbi:hypothetical protein CBR_g10818 [Chara braunii]|uniref:DNA replication licensing factor MCM4 n=1 Tax=Chara braunii TaxID=69332 RepID=A0A388KPA8_CHABU|nr:hypothetical protein CBR_g10818 [Chara braunii]|eukprot:GBG71882.1 hypothetical protein CBR_g10818 [Chara braunii]